MRVAFSRCVECERDQPNFCFENKIRPESVEEEYAATRATCIDCQHDFVAKELADRRQADIEALASGDRRRRDMFRYCAPAWRDREKIKALYAEARRLTAATGVDHHIDHIMPIMHKDFCGLHVHWNLQILRASDNLSKGNRLNRGALDVMGAEMLAELRA